MEEENANPKAINRHDGKYLNILSQLQDQANLEATLSLNDYLVSLLLFIIFPDNKYLLSLPLLVLLLQHCWEVLLC